MTRTVIITLTCIVTAIILYVCGHIQGYVDAERDCYDTMLKPDTCTCCRIEISHSGDKDLLMILGCWRDNYKRPVLMPFVYKLNEKIKE